MTVVTASSGMGFDLSFNLKGADNTTFDAPASRCPLKAPLGSSAGTVGSLKTPVVSTTSFTLCSDHLISFGFLLSCKIVTGTPLTVKVPSFSFRFSITLAPLWPYRKLARRP